MSRLPTSMPVSRSPLRAGFTLLELLIALIVIGVVASIAIPAFFERSEVTLDSACRLLAEDLRAAQNRAAFLQTEVRIQFDAEGDGYTVVDDQGRVLASPSGPGDFVRRYSKDAVFEGVTVSHLDCGPMRRIAYDPDGRSPEGGLVVLSYSGDSRVVRVNAGDGLIDLPDVASPWADDGR